MDDSVTKEEQKKAEMSVLSQIPEAAEDGYAYFWEKEATTPESGTHDEAVIYRIEYDTYLRKLVYDLQKRTLGPKIPLSDIKPADTSIIKWIHKILDSYPKLESDTIDDVLTSFRGKLRTSSKRKGAFIVGALLLPDKFLLVHSRIDPGLFKEKHVSREMRTADLVLHAKSVLRADLIQTTEDGIFLSAYEYDKSLSKGHAQFWGIKPTLIRWERPSTIRFILRIDSEDGVFEKSATIDEVSQLLESGEITSTGEANIGTQEATIERVEMGRGNYTFQEFYQQYIIISEDVLGYHTHFESLVDPSVLMAYDESSTRKYMYEEDIDYLYEITPSEHIELKEKKHAHYVLCYFTDVYPGIRPLPILTQSLHRALFTKAKMKILHVGEDIALEPVRLGNLEIHNELDIDEESVEFVNTLLKKLADAASKKTKTLIQIIVTRYLKKTIANQHLPIMFDFIFRDILQPSLSGFFKDPSMLMKEDLVDFKSKDAFLSSSKDFVKKNLAPTIRKYVRGEKLERLVIVYGIEDDGHVNAISNLPNDRVTAIQNLANKELAKEGITIEAYPVNTSGGFLLLVLLFRE